jgi:hypothetical protein
MLALVYVVCVVGSWLSLQSKGEGRKRLYTLRTDSAGTLRERIGSEPVVDESSVSDILFRVSESENHSLPSLNPRRARISPLPSLPFLGATLMPLFLSLLSLLAVKAATVTLNWKIDWIDNVNPDNALPRRAIGVNGAWPVSPVHVMLFDTLVINVINGLDVATCSLF